MAHTPHNEPWSVDPYDDGYNPDAAKDMNGKDYGKGDSVLIKIIYPVAVLILSAGLLFVGKSTMSIKTCGGFILAGGWLAVVPLAIASAVTVGAQDYSGMRRVRGIVIIAAGLVLFGVLSWWFMTTQRIAI